MKKTGSRLFTVLACAALAFPAAAAEVEFYQTVDRNKVGTEDTLRLTIVVGNAPDGATLQFPAPNDFEVLSRNSSSQMTYQLGSGGSGTIKRVQKYVLVLRANRTGNLKIPAAVLSTGGKDLKTDPVTVEVVKGRLAPDPAQQQAQRQQQQPPGFPGFPPGFGLPGADGDDDGFGAFPEPEIPRSDSDLFVKTVVDKTSLFVGEQLTLSIIAYSRVDLSGVDPVVMPKLEGFWSEDLKSPVTLVDEHVTVKGVPYRAYLLRRKALWPMKPGNVTIGSSEVDLTTGFLFNSRRVHRRSDPISLEIKPLPANAKGASVGKWRISAEVPSTTVAVGTPVQLKVTLEGKGSLKFLANPEVTMPPSVRVYEPEVTEKYQPDAVAGGVRRLEYVLLPSQTGSFTIPSLSVKSFDVEKGRVDDSKTDPITITVTPGAGGATVAAIGSAGESGSDGPKNRLDGGGLKALRHTARFTPQATELWKRPWFVPLAVGPFGLVAVLSAVQAVRRRGGQNDPNALKKRLAKAARLRLAAAEKLREKGKTEDFYNEIEKALLSFIESKLGTTVIGLTRDQLDLKLREANASDEVRAQLRGVLDTCDMGRFAPGMGDDQARVRALDEAVKAITAWDTK